MPKTKGKKRRRRAGSKPIYTTPHRANREWMTTEQWRIACEAMAKQVAPTSTHMDAAPAPPARDRAYDRRWLLVVPRGTDHCHRCGHLIRKDADAVYRHAEQPEVLCLRCANRRGIDYQPSLRWEARAERRRSGSATRSRARRWTAT